MDFSEKIYALRKDKGYTQEQLAEQLDVSRQSISKWEAGQAMPEPDKIVALADLFGVTTDYLLRLDNAGNLPEMALEYHEWRNFAPHDRLCRVSYLHIPLPA